MTVALCNGKGGSGKTTLSVLLASALAEAGHQAAILDTDPQKTATLWIKEAGGIEIAQNGKRYGVLFIDTPPRLESPEVAEAVRRADIVLLPTSPSPADLFTTRETVNMIERHKSRKKELRDL